MIKVNSIEYLIVWRKYVLEYNEDSNKNGTNVTKAERVVKDLVFVEKSEDSETQQKIYLRDEHILEDMIELPVTQLVGQHR